MDFRIGEGYDLHCIGPERPLIIGGCAVPRDGNWGLQGHSDADVLLHAVTDAVIGALALGNIGTWFPDTDERWRGADSRKLLQAVLNDPRLEGWQLVNLDSTVIAQVPKLNPYIPEMRTVIAGIFQVPVECVSVKAKTNEQMDAVGRKEAIAARAVVLLRRRDSWNRN